MPMGTESIFDTLVITTADNLGAHQIGRGGGGLKLGLLRELESVDIVWPLILKFKLYLTTLTLFLRKRGAR